jgi:hypothetical protein
MKPSEFIKVTFDTEALAERVASDAEAIVAFMLRASRSMQELRDAYDADPAADHRVLFDGLASWQESMREGLDTETLTPAQKEAMLVLIGAVGAAPPVVPEQSAPRKTRADKGKPRKAASPADANNETKARASQILAFVTNSGPATVPGLMASVGGSQNEVGQALELTGLLSWVTQREGDKDPVQVYGTAEQKTSDQRCAGVIVPPDGTNVFVQP